MNVVFYHSNCNDGWFSAFSIWEKAKETTLCIPITYKEFQNQTPDEFIEMCFVDKITQASISSSCALSAKYVEEYGKTSVTAYLVDISVPKVILERISEMFNEVIVLDHHESANTMYQSDTDFKGGPISSDLGFYKFKENTKIYMDEVHSGAKLTWHFMNPMVKTPPYYIQLVSEYDTWKKTSKDADYFAAGFKALSCTKFKETETKVINRVLETIELGKVVEGNREHRARLAINQGRPVEIMHNNQMFKGFMVNSNFDISSLIGSMLVEEHEYDVGLIYNIDKDNTVNWTIRSKKPFSCLFIAEYFGGGGHHQACGFKTTFNYLVYLINSGIISISEKTNTIRL